MVTACEKISQMRRMGERLRERVVHHPKMKA
jgi:hypothetical protein